MASKEIPASGFLSVSKDITESIRKIIDKSSIKFIHGIKLDTKNGKTEDRILVLATWRLYFLAPKVPTKVETTFNFLEIRALNSHPDHQVVIDTDKSSYSLRFESRENLNHVVSHINLALSRIFNNSIFAPSICHSDSDLSEGSRKYSPSSETSVETQRACGGFSETYAALCDYNGISCKEEVQWDVDTIYHSQDSREFNLLDFSHLESRDLAVIVASMAYNTWFTKLYCKDLRIGSEVTEQVLHTVSKSSSLEEITLENAGLKSDFPQKMSAALSENPASVIHSLNLAHNSLDNQGVSNLIQQVCRLSKGLRLLNLSKTSLTSKGVVSLSQALCSSDEYSNSLLHLDLSKNPGVLSGEDASNLYLFLSQPNCLVHLDLSGTDCSVDSLFGALLRGCCADLSFLNLSKNSLSHRKVKDTLPLFRQFFSSAFSLTYVSLASMKLPPDVLRALLTGLTSNPHINDLHLDISGCELRSAGAAVFQELFPRVSAIGTLDISDNGLDADLLTVLPALSRHPSLKHLYLGKNFNIKNRVLDEVLQKLVHLIQEEECALQSLSLADSRLRSRGTVLVNALGSNTCLRKVDLSGNNMDDIGAKMLSKALQINTTLRSVTWDRNSTSAAGFLDVARALEHNFTLQYMPLPLSDISQAYRSAPERTEQALTKIQRSLVRNNQTQRFSQRQALRLHQGLVTSTAEQVMERLCVRVQQQVCVLRGVGEMEEIQAAKQVLKEARNSRALYPSLCELAHVLSVDGPVRQRLDSLAGELAKAADKELQVIVDSMVSLCRELCPLSSSAAERLSPPLSSVSERVSIPRSAIRAALMERAAQDIHRALEEVKLSVVSYLTNSIVDQILQELYATHKTLTRQVSHVKHWEGTCKDGTGWRFNRHRDSLDITDEELSTSIDTIAIKKRSSRTRRIRPVSTRLSLCDDSSSSPPPSVPSYSSPLSRSASWEGLSELPTQGLPLHHVTRVRPRPPRRHKGGHIPAETHCSENGGISPLDDGLPDFYTKRVLPDSQLSSLHKAHSLRRKKRRNMLAIFGFRKNRNQTLSSQGPESEAEVYGDGCHVVATAPTGAATENVYTLLQPPRAAARAGSPGEGADERMNYHQGKNTLVLSPPPVPGIPHPGVGGSKHPFYSPREISEVDSVFEHPMETDRYCVDDKHRTTDALHADKPRIEAWQGDHHVEKQRFDSKLQERSLGEARTADRQTDKYWTESRHPDRHMDRQWTVDRHTQRQIDRKIERQWMGGRQIDRSWSENRPTDVQVDNQWTENRHGSRKTERQVHALHLAQRPLPPYPSDRTPSPKQETDPLKSAEAAATDWHQQDAQGDRQMCPDTGGGFTEGWRGGGGGGGGRAPPCAKPDPPPQSSKPNLSKLRQRHRLESSDALRGTEEEADVDKYPGKMEKKEREKRRDSEGQPPPIPEKPKTSSYVTFPKESANERNLPPPPVPPPVNKPVHGLPDRAASQGEEGLRPQAPVKPQRHRKAMSCDAGTDRESPNNVEKPPNRKPPVKKPRLPQNRNKSLDLSDSLNSASGHSELL
ncbi:capping protein, Arp2/3 and myosin-I linker protein 3-like isoform X1 [Sander lucioperca]|uniref:capping protein, Arp2/3 and myosin-I linker protein 3-like isoform X1 n=1 Tax=Sander lucioperca TaxID=283035 RepID=UPI00125D5FD7|nr:capping protein, Arp2/3 and myosin-I linker protein 3-like isoform X1 [Sander lucioperca]